VRSISEAVAPIITLHNQWRQRTTPSLKSTFFVPEYTSGAFYFTLLSLTNSTPEISGVWYQTEKKKKKKTSDSKFF